MIGLNCVAADNIEDADDQEEAVYTCPPSELGEWVVGRLLNLADDASDNGDKPRKLDKPLVLTLTISIQRGGEKRGEGHGTERTKAIDVVASANGSPKMLPDWKPRRL